MTMKKIGALLLSSALLAAGPAAAQGFAEWDADGDGVLAQEEWDAGVASSSLFDNWDADGDGTITATEYESGLFGWFDDDGDGALSVAEWDAGVDAWYGEEAVDFDVAAWDDDGDGTITEAEFSSEFATAGPFEDFTTEAGVETTAVEGGDAVGVAEQDFIAGLFDWFDADDDTGIVADEAGWFG